MGKIRQWLPFSFAEKVKIEDTKAKPQRVLAIAGKSRKPQTERDREIEV